MTPKLKLCFLGGAGGHFLSNMLYQLQTKPAVHNDVHFHKKPKSPDIYLTHIFENDCKYFAGTSKFNMYINCMYKHDINDHQIDTLDEQQQLKVYSNAARFTIAFPPEHRLDIIDINYDDIFTNEKKFVDDCFFMFDSAGIVYDKDRDLALACVENFKQTCIDVKLDFGNYESLLWLGWCLGLEWVLCNDIPVLNSKQEVQEYLYNKKDIFNDITKKFNLVNEYA